MTLREWREKEGLSLHAAGARLGWSHAYVSALERGAMSPTIRKCDEVERLTGGAVTRLDWPSKKVVDMPARIARWRASLSALAKKSKGL